MAQQQAPRSSLWPRLLVGAGAAAFVAGSIVLSTSPVAAAGLERFSGCDELQAHLEGTSAVADVEDGDESAAGAASMREVGGDLATGDSAQALAPLSGSDGTNVQVQGVDERDLVEVLQDGRILVARPDRILLIDASGQKVLSSLPVPSEPQITFDDERATLWVVSTDWQATTLTRTVVSDDGFSGTATWSVAGRLVDLRRNGGRVHLVAVDEDFHPMAVDDLGATGGAREEEPSIPFGGTSPVPCDEVLHSPLPGGPATTLVASFDSTGELAPVAATEIVGAGDNVLVTDVAAYVSTPSYDGDQMVTGIHRFDLDELRHTGSGSVNGRLLNQFSLDEHAGHLRAAVTIGGGGFIGRPMPIEGDAIDVMPPEPGPAGEPLNEIVVLDLDGTLDVVGRTARFGHAGETLHGVRFAGDVGYAVTFLQTDPFYVIDLAVPTSPRILGELEIPGFSAYLHPISPTEVIGFGPDAEGQVAARLFDTSDPTAPRVVDTVTIAPDSPIVYDHHALRVDGERLVVAANQWVTEPTARCAAIVPDEPARAELERRINDLYAQLDELYRELEGEQIETIPPDVDAIERQIQDLSECVYPDAFPRARIVTLAPGAGALRVTTVDTEASEAQRVIPVDGGFLIVGADVTRVTSTGAIANQLV